MPTPKTTSSALAAAAIMTMGFTAKAGAREIVRYDAEVRPGTIVVKTAERKLYFVLGDGRLVAHAVSFGAGGQGEQRSDGGCREGA